MGFQTWLPGVLRDAGLTVVEVSGWRTRSADEDSDASSYNPGGVIIHETRGSANSTDAGEIGVLINGRVGLSGPIAQCYIGRDGRWHIVAAGLCHHVKTGWGGPFAGWGNTRLLGIEPAHSVDEDWADKPQQYRSYVRGVAAIVKYKGWPPPVGHKEHQPGDKPDPEFSMTRFRADVAAVIAGKDDDMDAEQFLALLKDPKVSKEMSRLPWAYNYFGRSSQTVVLAGMDELAAAEAREVARDAAQTALIQGLVQVGGTTLTADQLAALTAAVREAAAAAGQAVLDRLEAAAKAEADALGAS